MAYIFDNPICMECGSICTLEGTCTSCGWMPFACFKLKLVAARAEGKAEGIREEREACAEQLEASARKWAQAGIIKSVSVSSVLWEEVKKLRARGGK